MTTTPSRLKAVAQPQYTCKYCKKVLVRESSYLAHECKQMKREAELKTPVGQTAWYYYQLWLREQRRMPPPAASFLTSKYFRTFIEFVKFAKTVDLPVPERFIKVMVMKGYTPTMWRNDDVYSIYIEWLDRKLPPIEQAKLSITTLMDYTEKRGTSLSAALSDMPVSDAIHLIRSRQLSPWLIMFSRTFQHLFTERASTEQRIILENLIRPEYWLDKKENHPEAVAVIKTLVAEMGI